MTGLETRVRVAHAALTDIVPSFPSFLAQLDDCRSGYPAKASGATSEPGQSLPSSDGGVYVALTGPEAIMEAFLEAKPPVPDVDARTVSTLVDRIGKDVAQLEQLVARYPGRPLVSPTTEEAPEDWCASCFRDGQHHEPITLDRHGVPKYAHLCRWCGEWQTRFKELPPVNLLQRRHQGRRITSADVDNYERDLRRRRAKKKNKKRNKK